MGLKFRRQHILSPYIVDFYSCRERLAVEIDGPAHDKEARRSCDERRTRLLRHQYQVEVIRFDHDHVLKDIDDVVYEIMMWIEAARDETQTPQKIQ